eukprot:TRINITY_DN15640_c0_g1_i1.p1 TRINITY_DN15640_c0_g1~~TRINITY_DN15640_c0_g1_i1.p1  ORF type:complete len:393 (+),score=105.36 TRINITY_DN15640_c0_g1_i1:132-1310(+)
MLTETKKRMFILSFIVLCFITVKVRQAWKESQEELEQQPKEQRTVDGKSTERFPIVTPADGATAGGTTTEEIDRETLYDDNDSFEVLWNVHRKKIDSAAFLFHMKIPKCADRSLSLFSQADCNIAVSKKEQTKNDILELLLTDSTCRYIGAPLPYSSINYNKDQPGFFGHIPFIKPPVTATFFCHPFDWILRAAKDEIKAKRYKTLEDGFNSKTGLLGIDEIQARYLSIDNLPPVSESAVFATIPKERKHVDADKKKDYTLYIQQIEKRILNIDFFGISDYYDASLCLLKYTFYLEGWQNCSVVCLPPPNELTSQEERVRNEIAGIPEDVLKEVLIDYTFDSLIYAYALRVFEFRLREMEKQTHSKLICGPSLRNPYEATEKHFRELLKLTN